MIPALIQRPSSSSLDQGIELLRVFIPSNAFQRFFLMMSKPVPSGISMKRDSQICCLFAAKYVSAKLLQRHPASVKSFSKTFPEIFLEPFFELFQREAVVLRAFVFDGIRRGKRPDLAAALYAKPAGKSE